MKERVDEFSAIHEGRQVEGNLNLEGEMEGEMGTWAGGTPCMFVTYSQATEQRWKGSWQEGWDNWNKRDDHSNSGQRWVTVHKLECVRDIELANNLFRFFHAMWWKNFVGQPYTILLSIPQASSNFEPWFWHDGGTQPQESSCPAPSLPAVGDGGSVWIHRDGLEGWLLRRWPLLPVCVSWRDFGHQCSEPVPPRFLIHQLSEPPSGFYYKEVISLPLCSAS